MPYVETTKEQKLEAIRKACVAANPEIDDGEKVSSRGATVHLADVLFAIASQWKAINGYGGIMPADLRANRTTIDGILSRWTLHTDDLTAQSEECIDFFIRSLPVA